MKRFLCFLCGAISKEQFVFDYLTLFMYFNNNLLTGINVMIRKMLKAHGNGNVLAWYFIGLNVCYSKASSSEEKYQFIALSHVMVNNYH